MAFYGTLQDLSIVELIHQLHVTRKTGELIIIGDDEEAKLFYEKGILVHAVMGNLRGLGVVVSIAHWTEGEFEFRQGVKTSSRTLNWSLCGIVMDAIRRHGNLKLGEGTVANLESKGGHVQDASAQQFSDFIVFKALIEYFGENSFAQYGCVIDADRTMLIEVCDRNVGPSDIEDFRRALFEKYSQSVSTGVASVKLQDGDGTIVTIHLGQDRTLMVLNQNTSSIGEGVDEMNRLASTLAVVAA